MILIKIIKSNLGRTRIQNYDTGESYQIKFGGTNIQIVDDTRSNLSNTNN